MKKKRGHYSVHPRYTAGSPAMVDEATAQRVAAQEKDGHAAALSGIYGQADVEKARRLGLTGISEFLVKTKKGWAVHDLVTGEVYTRPFARSEPTARRYH